MSDQTDQTHPIDIYSGFDHKHAPGGAELPQYLSEFAKRRLRHYQVAAAFHRSVSRRTLDPMSSKASDWREFGEAGMIAERRAAAVIGDQISIRVEGADVDLPAEPIIGDEPALPDTEGEPALVAIRQARYQAMLAAFIENAEDSIAEWEEQRSTQPRLQVRQDQLREWARRQRLEAKLRELQGELVQPLGEGCVTLMAKQGEWPDITLWEPDAYHPVFPDGTLTEFPEKVHLAFEYTKAGQLGEENWLRRVTWEMRDIILEGDEDGQLAPRTLLSRSEPVTRTCVYSDERWNLGDSTTWDENNLLESLDDPTETGEVEDPITGEMVPAVEVDLHLDFIPMVHFPRRMLSLHHHAPSMFVDAAQLLDTIGDCDTDATRASGFTGAPPILAKNVRVGPTDAGVIRYRPGQMFFGDEKSDLKALEMGNALERLQNRGESLRDLMYSVMAAPKALVGRDSEQSRDQSGVARETAFTPFVQTIRDARLAADAKHDLLLEFVQRMAIESGAIEGDLEVYPASIELGSFMPNDLQHLIEMIVALAGQELMVPELAFRWLEDAGMDVGDIQILLEALQSRDVDRAEAIAGMLGRKYGADYLSIPFDEEESAGEIGGFDPDAAPQPPEIVLDDRTGVQQ